MPDASWDATVLQPPYPDGEGANHPRSRGPKGALLLDPKSSAIVFLSLWRNLLKKIRRDIGVPLAEVRSGKFLFCAYPVYLAVMPERVLHVNDHLAKAIPRGSDHCGSDVSSIDGSIHTAELYENACVDENFEEFNEEFIDELNKLEREYVDSLHVEKAPTNVSYNRSTQPCGGQDKHLTDFEKDNFHAENVTPERPCSAYFRASQFVSPAEVFKALSDDGFTTEHIRCLQRKPSGEIYVTFSTKNLRDKFIQQRCFSLHGKPHVANDTEGSIASLTIYDAPYE